MAFWYNNRWGGIYVYHLIYLLLLNIIYWNWLHKDTLTCFYEKNRAMLKSLWDDPFIRKSWDLFDFEMINSTALWITELMKFKEHPRNKHALQFYTVTFWLSWSSEASVHCHNMQDMLAWINASLLFMATWFTRGHLGTFCFVSKQIFEICSLLTNSIRYCEF